MATVLSPTMTVREFENGYWYRLTRWREAQITRGAKPTYGDIVRQYVALNRMPRFEKVPVVCYVNFVAEFLASNTTATRAAALAAWRELKTLDAPKTYAAWVRARRRLVPGILMAVLAIAASACRPSADATSASGSADDPRQALTRFTTMLEHRDPALIDEFADDEDVMVVGSEASEIEIGRQQIAQMIKTLSTGPSVHFDWKQTRSGSKGDVAWLFAAGDVMVTDNGKTTRLPYRVTGVLERKNGAWKWRQFHGSEPVMR